MSTPDAIAAMAQLWHHPAGRRAALGKPLSPTMTARDGFAAKTMLPMAPTLPISSRPQDGLWLLMLDANVFHRLDGLWQLRSNAAWDHVLAQRPYLLDWIADVSERAQRMGKTPSGLFPLPRSTPGDDG